MKDMMVELLNSIRVGVRSFLEKRKKSLVQITWIVSFSFLFSCAPVKFSKPEQLGSCANCPYVDLNTYAWDTGSWNTCSLNCGGGTQTRTVQCLSSKAAVVADSNCTGSKPATSQSCNTQACTTPTRDVTTSKTVVASDNQVDLMMVLDDSGSMELDNPKLAMRMAGFLNELQAAAVDYRVCVTTTDTGYYEGNPIQWTGLSSPVITPATVNKQLVFDQTIADIGAGYSSDERGIMAMNLMVTKNSTHQCFRDRAALSVILISDEDERSVGGDSSRSSAQFQPLEPMDYPQSFINTVATTFNSGSFVKPLTVNSIIVNDDACEAAQDLQGSPSFKGLKYRELSDLTGGGIGSICDDDYTRNLQFFKDRIIKSISSLKLECAPFGNPVVTTAPTVPGLTTSLTGDTMNFTPVLPLGTVVTVNYKCTL